MNSVKKLWCILIGHRWFNRGYIRLKGDEYAMYRCAKYNHRVCLRCDREEILVKEEP